MIPEELFLTARKNTSRSGLTDFLHAQSIDPSNDADKRAATASYRELPLLLDQNLQNFSCEILKKSRGAKIDENSRFRAVLWTGGATATRNGQNFSGNFGDFVRLLQERAKFFAKKGEGWVIEPTTNVDGHRTNASTSSIHALFLDCDGRGTWDSLLKTLENLSFFFVAYQSGGWTPEKPKWRVVLPLVEPFNTSTEKFQSAWKQLYHHARVVFGSVAQLRGEGFDPATDTPSCPWFLTERRQISDPPREVLWRPGHALDLKAFVLEIPTVIIEEPAVREVSRGPRTASEGLSDEKIEEIIETLSKATRSIPSGRHELYLALSGTLLDRGIPPNEVLAIIETVSSNYPRPKPALHADNIRTAWTTIGRWEAEKRVTQIATLQARWPNVASAVDEVLPGESNKLNEMMKSSFGIETPLVLPEQPQQSQPKKKRRRLTSLGKEILPIVASMKKSDDDRRRYAGSLVDRILDGEPFQGGTPEQVDILVCFTAEQLGYNLPIKTTWGEVLDLASATLLSMDFTQSVERVKKAEEAFLKGQKKKREFIQTTKDAVERDREEARIMEQASIAIVKKGRQ